MPNKTTVERVIPESPHGYNLAVVMDILDIVRTNREVFDMSDWYRNSAETCTDATPTVAQDKAADIEELKVCGTTACIAGWAGLLTERVIYRWQLDARATAEARERTGTDVECFTGDYVVPANAPGDVDDFSYPYNSRLGDRAISSWKSVGVDALNISYYEADILFFVSDEDGERYLSEMLEGKSVTEIRDEIYDERYPDGNYNSNYDSDDDSDDDCQCSLCTGEDA